MDWSAPDEELHQFHNEQTRELGAHLCGRRLYEVMLYWETADQDPKAGAVELELARSVAGVAEGRVLGTTWRARLREGERLVSCRGVGLYWL